MARREFVREIDVNHHFRWSLLLPRPSQVPVEASWTRRANEGTRTEDGAKRKTYFSTLIAI